MSKDQLTELILDLYSTRSEAKKYFDFYLNPDVEKLVQKTSASIDKELSRSKRGYSKARISQIKKTLKDFDSYQPGPDAIFEILSFTLKQMIYYERYNTFQQAQLNGVIWVITKMIDYADKQLILDKAISSIEKITQLNNIGRNYFRNKVKEIALSILQEKSTQLYHIPE